MRLRALPATALAATALALLGSACGGRSTGSGLGARLLSVADLPAGWSAVRANPKDVQTSAPCLSSLPANSRGWTHETAAFVQGTSIPSLGEVVATGPQARARWRDLSRALAGCRTAKITIAGKPATATVRPMSFPRVAGVTSAYAWAFTTAGLRIGFDLVLFEAGRDVGYVSYADLGPPAVATVKTFVDAAVAKAKTGSTARVSGAVSIASAPVRTAQTTPGPVAYRSIGSGPPLVLIMGYGGTMEGWDRLFVDALARRYRVVAFDNAGVGGTRALPAPLTIDAMADQTGALIDALGLKQANVLGWSMGSMIAQALAVLHPDQVRRLVLCASFPGNGEAVRPSRAELDAFESGDPQKVMAALFPADQTSAQKTYLAALSSYPGAPSAPADVTAAQGHAIDDWWDGKDAAGERAAEIAVPTLIADGTEDRLDPLTNSRNLARLIRGAQLALYPDAGHAFLFQERASFIPRIESFLG